MIRRLSFTCAFLGAAAFAASGLAGCTSSTERDKYVVFFTTGSTALDEAGQEVVSAAAEDARRSHASTVEVEGYAAAHGDLSADEMLAVTRAKSVVAMLGQDGVGSAHIIQTAHSPANNADSRVAARRVTIDVSP